MSKKGNLSAALGQFDKHSKAKPPTNKDHGMSRQPPSRQGKKAITGYFHPEVTKQLKLMAVAGDTTVQALLTEALNDLFKKHGKPHIA